MNAQVYGIKPGRLDLLVEYTQLVDKCFELEEMMWDRELTFGQDYVYWSISDELQSVVQQRISMHDRYGISWIELEQMKQAGY